MPKDKPNKQKHDHPGGSGAVLGVRVMRNSSVQAVSLIVANAMQLVSILVVAAFLGPDEMARFGLLTFLAGLVTQIASLLVKPGTVRRTFGGGDDDDDDDDDDEVVSSSPPHTPRGRARLGDRARGHLRGADLRLQAPGRRRPARRPRGREPGRARRPALGRDARLQDLRHHALARAAPGGVPDRRHLAAAARPRGADRVPRHRLRGRGGDPRHPGRHGGRGHRRASSCSSAASSRTSTSARSSRSSSAAATGRRS